jgi:hypothetical protein
MATMYQTGGYPNGSIRSIEVTRVTEKTVYYNNSAGREVSERRTTTYYQWHDTFQEAKDYLLEQYGRKIENTKDKLQKLRSVLGQIESLKES